MVAIIKAVIFDMDGVVIDSTELDYAAWKDTLLKLGVNISFQDYKKFLGMKGTEVIKKYAPNITESEASKIQNTKENYFINQVKKIGIKPVDGVIELVKSLKNKHYKIALATAAPEDKLNAALNSLKIKHLFDTISNADEVENGKPHPEIFLNAARKLNHNPNECVVIEDAANGVRAAKAGNFMCIAIATTHSAKELKEADHIINKYSEFKMEWLK